MLGLVVTDGRLIEISATVLILVTREAGRPQEIGTIGHRRVVIPAITAFRAETANLGTLGEVTKTEVKENLGTPGA